MDLPYKLVGLGFKRIARAKVAVTHLHAFSMTQYMRKAYRRIRDYYVFSKLGFRIYRWNSFDRLRLLKVVLAIFTLIPMFKDAMNAYRRKPDLAWFLNWPLCFLTLLIYCVKELLSGLYLITRAK